MGDFYELLSAIRQYESDRAIRILRSNPSFCELENSGGQSPLWLACFYGDLLVVSELLSEKYAPFLQLWSMDASLRDGLAVAQSYGHDDIVSALEAHFDKEAATHRLTTRVSKVDTSNRLKEFFFSGFRDWYEAGLLVSQKRYAFAFVPILALLFLYVSGFFYNDTDYFDVHEILANSGSDKIERSVQTALLEKKEQSVSDKFDAKRMLRRRGIGLDINKSITGLGDLGSDSSIIIECEFTLPLNGEPAETFKIAAEIQTDDQVYVYSNVVEYDKIEMENKDYIFSHAINTCF